MQPREEAPQEADPEREHTVRRIVVDRVAAHFRAHGAWVEPNRFERYTARQFDAGMAASLAMLPRVAGPDFLDLFEPTWSGSANVAFTVAFGLTYSRAIAALAAANPDDCKDCASACALFNFGISLIDRMVDTEPERGAVLLELLRCVMPDWERLHALAENETRADARIILRIAAAFFERLAALERPDGDSIETLKRLLRSALDAESATLPGRNENEEQVARDKSVLPLLAMGEITIAALELPSRQRDVMRRIALYAGEAIGLADDLADVTTDSRFGFPNAILGKIRRRRDPELHAENLAALESGTQIAAAAAELLERIERVDAAAAKAGAPEDARRGMREFLTMHVRGWLGA